MEPIANHQMLELTYQPAFSVRDGIIAYANQAALQRQVSVGTPMESLLCDNQEEYAAFREGCLYLPMSISGVRYSATLLWLDHQQIVLLDPEDAASELQALSLAARELREPLTRIMTLSESLFSDLESAPETHSRIAGINRGFYQLLRLVNNLSLAACLTEDRPLSLKNHDLVDLVGRISGQAAALAVHRGLTVRFVCSLERHICAVSRDTLEQILFHLLSNAFKFTPEGGTITVELRRVGGRLLISVTDTGCGIPEDRLETLFSGYLRDRRMDPPPHGLGLGLPLCRRLAEAHGGALMAESTPGKGSRFTLSLPDQQTDAELSDISIDYTGGFNQTLLALADALPAEAFLLRNQD